MRKRRWIVECRKPDGSLDFSDPQPGTVFGLKAIDGMDEDTMAKVIFDHADRRGLPEPVMEGGSIGRWPSILDPRWSAREKTW